MAVNVRGAFLSVRACLPAMLAQRAGAIVITSSNSAFVATPNTTAYCATKGALAALGGPWPSNLSPMEFASTACVLEIPTRRCAIEPGPWK